MDVDMSPAQRPQKVGKQFPRIICKTNVKSTKTITLDVPQSTGIFKEIVRSRANVTTLRTISWSSIRESKRMLEAHFCDIVGIL